MRKCSCANKTPHPNICMVEDAVALMDRLVPSEATEWSSYVNVVISFRVTFKNRTFSFRLTRTRPSMPNANVQVERPFQNRRLREHIGSFTAWCDLRVSGRCLLYTDFIAVCVCKASTVWMAILLKNIVANKKVALSALGQKWYQKHR